MAKYMSLAAVLLRAVSAVDPNTNTRPIGVDFGSNGSSGSGGHEQDSKISVAADGSLTELDSANDPEFDRYWKELEKGFHEHSRAGDASGTGLYSVSDMTQTETGTAHAHQAAFYLPGKFDTSLLESTQHGASFMDQMDQITSRAASMLEQGDVLGGMQTPTPAPAAPPPAPAAGAPAPGPPAPAGEPTPAPTEEGGGTSFGMYLFLGILAVHAAVVIFMVIQGVWGWDKKSFWGYAVIVITGGLINAYGAKLLIDPDATLNFIGNAVALGISVFNVIKAVPCMCCIESVREKAKLCGGLLCQGVLHLLISIIYICAAQFLHASITLLMIGIGPFIGACMVIWGWFAGDESMYDAAMEYLTDVGNQISNAAEDGWEATQGAFGFGEENWQGPNTIIIEDCGESGVVGTYTYNKPTNGYHLHGKEMETSKYIIRYNNGSWQIVKSAKGTVLYYSKIGQDPTKGPPAKGWLVKEGERPGPKCTLEDFNEVSVLVDFKGQMDSLQSMSNEWGQAFGLVQEDAPEVPRTICIVSRFMNKQHEEMRMGSYSMCFDKEGVPIPDGVVAGKVKDVFDGGMVLKTSTRTNISENIMIKLHMVPKTCAVIVCGIRVSGGKFKEWEDTGMNFGVSAFSTPVIKYPPKQIPQALPDAQQCILCYFFRVEAMNNCWCMIKKVMFVQSEFMLDLSEKC